MNVPVRGTKPIKAGLLRPGTGRKITATFSEKDRHRNQTPATEPPGMGSLSARGGKAQARMASCRVQRGLSGAQEQQAQRTNWPQQGMGEGRINQHRREKKGPSLSDLKPSCSSLF